ncbi:hypothetical protein VTN96DRAFT_1475 [Rasamsonia emersonii]|uniref:Uncharacterized protein n=1 Tax=Rasamsonia emersonii (strain ATCC 16479 / CBS 393.64 / IMI 116815) TaxID=1408163 RepID=A0A0F4YLV2_RASE3|nr:hypothetical protein T310_6771 [Rasamsonia emersonii CBS 393.64]KKA19257.1 hypothetical protein T310_6771 [Rasamsonia emersonii CBS 393.64]
MPPLQKSCRKRPADSDPDGEPPVKKFGRLHIGTLDNDNTSHEVATQESTTGEDSRSSDFMLLDDTKHTAYVYDLDRELEEIEAQEKRISFLPEIEKTLNSIPKAVLKDPKPDNEIVLYRVPTSLTVPEEKDSVRRAILESRARARAQQQRENEKIHTAKADTEYSKSTSQNSANVLLASPEDGNDVMDIDTES